MEYPQTTLDTSSFEFASLLGNATTVQQQETTVFSCGAATLFRLRLNRREQTDGKLIETTPDFRDCLKPVFGARG